MNNLRNRVLKILDNELFIETVSFPWINLAATNYYFIVQGKGSAQKIIWSDISLQEDVSFETVLENVPEDIQGKLLFYLDLFR